MMKKGETYLAPRHTVAVVDDDHGVRAALCNLLDSAGYRGCAFPGGEEFLAADLPGIACAIVDIGLARMDGFELAERLAPLRPGLPLIFITARGDALQRRRSAGLGAALLPKPVDADTLLALLRDAILASGAPD